MRRLLILSSFSLTLFVGAALPVYAANMPLLDPNFSIVPTECTACPCDYGGVLQLIQNLMNAAVSIGVIAFVLVAVYAGANIMLNPTNPESRTQARGMLINVVVGMVIVLAAWISVDFIMKTLYNENSYGPWNKILSPTKAGAWCIQETKPKLIPGLLGGLASNIVGGQGGPAGSGQGADSGGGTCTAPTNTSNACSTASLSTTCFANRVNDASSVCMLESSGGKVAVPSGSDKLNGGSGQSYSWGLWQINLTTTQLHTGSGTLDCPSAFTCSCQGSNLVGSSKPGACNCSVKSDAASQRLYAACTTAAQDPTTNTNAACGLYTQSGANGGFQPWSYSANKCSVPKH